MANLLSEIDAYDVDVIMRGDFMSFVDRSFTELNPGKILSNAGYLEMMAAKLQRCVEGKGPKRLIINLPPRALKSVMTSVALVAWVLGHNPTKQIICASYGQELADKHARDTRTLMSSSFYKRTFPNTYLSSKKFSVNEFVTTQEGFRMATSVGGVLTGRGADIIIIDDPLKPDEALSAVKREAVNEWLDNTVMSRLNNKETGIIIIVMQRLHQGDLVGHVLDRGEEWDVLKFPAIAEVDERYVIEGPLGTLIYERKAGEALDPSRESSQRLQRTKQTIGSYTFSSQYQQDPTPMHGNLVQSAWIQYFDVAGKLPAFTMVLQSWDTANKSGELNDYSVCTTWGVFDCSYYLLDVFRERLDYPTLRRKVLEQIEKHNPNIVVIEDRASGTQLIQDLRFESGLRIRPYSPPPQTDKIMRLHAQTAHFEAGRVLLPNKALWVSEYLREITAFPSSKFDDQVDSTTQALDYINKERPGTWAKLGRKS